MLITIKKKLRREHFRYDCTMDIKYCKISEYESGLILEEEIEDARNKKIEWQNGFIVDISGGGTRFTTSEEFSKNSYVLIKFNIVIKGRMKQFCVVTKVISSEKILNRNNQYENRGKYISMSPEETDQVVRYIFEEERKSRRNRKS
jgi:c-di-GMP-binding flagellar brake protein YcgR